jgi:hypothetical protein
MRTSSLSDFAPFYHQEICFLDGTISNNLKLGRLIAGTFTHENVVAAFPYDFSMEGRLIAIMAIHLFMGKSGKVYIVHNDGKEKSIHLCIEYTNKNGETFFIDQEGIGSGSDFLRKLFLWSDCKKINLEPFNIESLRLSQTPYTEDDDALKASHKLSGILELVIGKWDGEIY